MNEQELLIQRFLDQDLSLEERLRFLRTVDADPVLRRQWLNLELVVAEAARLPRSSPSDQFKSRVLDGLEAKSKGLGARLAELFTAPRTLEWNLAGAIAAACVAVAAGVGLVRLMPERVVEVPPAIRTVQPGAVGAASEPTVLVRLVLLEPSAQSVSVAGDFNGWNPIQTPLQRSTTGLWTATIALKPGRYEYMFVIDGKRWIADPLATEDAVDGFGARNAVLDVVT